MRTAAHDTAELSVAPLEPDQLDLLVQLLGSRSLAFEWRSGDRIAVALDARDEVRDLIDWTAAQDSASPDGAPVPTPTKDRPWFRRIAAWVLALVWVGPVLWPLSPALTAIVIVLAIRHWRTDRWLRWAAAVAVASQVLLATRLIDFWRYR